MSIWKLTPLLPEAPNWEASTFRGEVIVRANDERQARDLANAAFVIAVDVKPGHKTTLHPWTDSNIVSCVLIRNSEHSEQGPPAVLSPQQG